jgi:hypothetical protein
MGSPVSSGFYSRGFERGRNLYPIYTPPDGANNVFTSSASIHRRLRLAASKPRKHSLFFNPGQLGQCNANTLGAKKNRDWCFA